MQAFHVIPMWAGAKARNLWEAIQKAKPYITASSGIDPVPLPTSLRRDDIPVEACIQRMDNLLSAACSNNQKTP